MEYPSTEGPEVSEMPVGSVPPSAIATSGTDGSMPGRATRSDDGMSGRESRPSVVVRRGEPNDVYHADETHRSCSKVKTFLDSPLLYHKRYIAKSLPPLSGKALEHGTLLHRWFEEGDDFLELLVCPPSETLTATGLLGKEAEKWVKNHAPEGAVVVGPKEKAQIIAEVEAIKAHADATELRSTIREREIGAYWETADGDRLKCRFDALTSDGIVLDLKTTSEEDILAGFYQSVIRFRYHLQCAWYMRGMEAMGLEPKPLVFIVISTAPQHDCQVVTLPAEVIAAGQRLMDRALADLRLREDLDWWLPERHGEVVELPFPAHVLGRL